MAAYVKGYSIQYAILCQYRSILLQTALLWATSDYVSSGTRTNARTTCDDEHKDDVTSEPHPHSGRLQKIEEATRWTNGMPRSLNLYRLIKRIRLLLFLVAFLLISVSQLRMTSPRRPPDEDDVDTTFMGATVGTTMAPSSSSDRVNNSFARIPLTRGTQTRAANVSQKLCVRRLRA